MDGTKITLFGINDTTKDVRISYKVTCLTDSRDVVESTGYLTAESSNPLITIDIEKGEKKFYLIEWEIRGDNPVCGKNHYFTNIIDIDFAEYKGALVKADMLEVEGF